MFDTDPTTEIVLETTAANATSTSLIKKSKTRSIPQCIFNKYTPFANENDSIDDIDEVVPIPSGMFNIDPISDIVVVTSATNVTRDSPIKVQPTTKSTPPIVSNTYECLTNENDDDDDDNDIECVDRTVAINQVPQIETSVRMNNNKMASPGRDERDDRGDDNTNKRPVVVEICELRNTEIKKKKSSTTAVLDLGTMITPGVDNGEDDALAVTMATKNLFEGKYNKNRMEKRSNM